MKDNYGRNIDYLRISITDRCNLRCGYCMPKGIRLAPMHDILTYEEIELICKAAVKAGITKFKITGGEPLVRLGCAGLIGKIRSIPGVSQVTLTTNGVLLGKYLDELMENGLDAVNISLDTLDREVFRKITGCDEADKVKESIRLAVEKKLPVKINTVLQKGINDHEWESLAELAKEAPVDVRFIEMMPIGYGKQCEMVSGDDIRQKLKELFPNMEEDHSVHGNGPAIYYKIPGFLGSIGFINAIHGKFCDQCNRIRLTASGEFKPCLCYGEHVDVKQMIRDMADESEEEKVERIEKIIAEAIQKKPQNHCFESREEITEDRQMVQIGG